MTRPAFHTLTLAAVMLLAAAPGAQQAGATRQTQPHQQPAAGTTQPHDMAARCQEMMKQHDAMMTEQKAADQRLDSLVAKMNSASGQAKVDATAAVVSEMVAQRKAMHRAMMGMHHGAMVHMSEHMRAGPDSAAMCPMMKMGGAKR